MQELRWTVEEYIKAAKENQLDGRWVKELENASARAHITRLEAMQLQMQQQTELLYQNQLDGLDRLMRETYREGYYHAAFELQKGIGVGWDLSGIDSGKLEKVLYAPWTTDGLTFRDRCWRDKQGLIASLNQHLVQGCIRGETPREAMQDIARQFGVSRSKASRLIMTESAYFHEVSQRDSYRDLGVEKVEIVETLDKYTCEICQGMDRKVILLEDDRPGETTPPFHPWCRGCTCPYFEDLGGERAARGEDGKTYYVPADMTYSEWKKGFVEGDKSDFDRIDDGTFIHYRKKSGQGDEKNGIMFDIEGGTQKLKAVMKSEDYKEYLKRLSEHENTGIQRLYADYADRISDIQYSVNGGYYHPTRNSLVFSYPPQSQINNGMDKYSTLAHEYGHFFDNVAKFQNLHYKEVDTLNSYVTIRNGEVKAFHRIPSSSDEFLGAVREDKKALNGILQKIKDDLLSTDASAGVQDAISGMFSGTYGKTVVWGHREDYYNRLYNRLISLGFQSELQKAYMELGVDDPSRIRVKSICKNYETASEMWANIMSAETCGGAELEYIKKYLPNAYQVFLEIIEKVE